MVSPILLRLHATQEVPLPPYFSLVFVTLRTMFSLVRGRVEEGSFFLLMLSYYGNLVAFCLIFKFFKVFILLSMVIKEKFSKMKREKLNFCLFT